MKYIITEKVNLNSCRAGNIIEVTSLKSAKIKATKSQCFYDTVLTIESLNGTLLSYKDKDKWIDII